MSVTFTEIRDYLRQPLIARLATLGEDNTPHVVPLWYVVDDERDEIVIMTDRSTRKVVNAQASPRGAVQVGGDPTDEPNRYTPGYLLQDDLLIETDHGKIAMKRITRHYLPSEQAEQLIERVCDTSDQVEILKPHIVIWQPSRQAVVSKQTREYGMSHRGISTSGV